MGRREALALSRASTGLRALTIGLAWLVIAGACTRSDPTVRPTPDPVGTASGSAATVAAIEPDELAEEILADGDVTAAEMERALLAAVQCIRARGFDATYEFRPRIGWSFSVATGTSDEFSELGDLAERALDECEGRYVMPLGSTYLALHGRSEAELEEAKQELRRCMKESGVDVPEGLPFPDWADLDPIVYAICAAPLGL